MRAERIKSKQAAARLLITLMEDLGRMNGTQMDDYDKAEFEKILYPVVNMVRDGLLPESGEAVCTLRRLIRDNRYRPNYSEVQEVVDKVMRLIGDRSASSGAYIVRHADQPPLTKEESDKHRRKAKEMVENLAKQLKDRTPDTLLKAERWEPKSWQDRPSDKIPPEYRDRAVRAAYNDLYRRGKGRSPFAAHAHALHMYKVHCEEWEAERGKELGEYA